MIKKGINNLVTHNGSVHADDVFACASLYILLDGRIKVTRTRDPEVIKAADIVFDVGGIYDPDQDRFDHHQKGGGGQRSNGIDYASFGLVWKKYGEKICGSKEVAEEIDRKIATPIDAYDNGIDIITPIHKNIFPYTAEQSILLYNPTWKEQNINKDDLFMSLVMKAVDILKREIVVAKDDLEGKNLMLEAYKKAEDKRLIILENDFPRYLLQKTFSSLPEPLYVVYPGEFGKNWKIEAVAENPSTLESRKLFPKEWRGFLGGDPKLKELTGVPEALFSHRTGFYMTASSKEGAIRIAEKALQVKSKKNLWHLLTN